MATQELWTIDQVVDFFQARGMHDLNKKWVQNRCDTGNLPYTLVGNRRRVRRDYVENLFAGWLKAAS